MQNTPEYLPQSKYSIHVTVILPRIPTRGSQQLAPLSHTTVMTRMCAHAGHSLYSIISQFPPPGIYCLAHNRSLTNLEWINKIFQILILYTVRSWFFSSGLTKPTFYLLLWNCYFKYSLQRPTSFNGNKRNFIVALWCFVLKHTHTK